MKTLTKFIILNLLISIGISTQLFAQSDVSGLYGHVGSSGNYDGWDNSTTIPLEIRHNGNYPINFYTNNTQQMVLDATGNLGIGVTSANTAFMIGGVNILWHNGSI